MKTYSFHSLLACVETLLLFLAVPNGDALANDEASPRARYTGAR